MNVSAGGLSRPHAAIEAEIRKNRVIRIAQTRHECERPSSASVHPAANIPRQNDADGRSGQVSAKHRLNLSGREIAGFTPLLP
jgi:hypothetical protein